MTRPPVEDIFFKNPRKNEIRKQRIDALRVTLENSPIHKPWFTWDLFQGHVRDLITAEMEKVHYDKKIGENLDTYGYMDKIRVGRENTIGRLREQLGLSARFMKQFMRVQPKKDGMLLPTL